MFSICVAAIVIQMIISVNIKLVFGETLILIAGGITYIAIMVHNGVWEKYKKGENNMWSDLLISIICSAIFSVIYGICLFQRSATEVQIIKLSLGFFIGIAILGFMVLRILGIYNCKNKKIYKIKKILYIFEKYIIILIKIY